MSLPSLVIADGVRYIANVVSPMDPSWVRDYSVEFIHVFWGWLQKFSLSVLVYFFLILSINFIHPESIHAQAKRELQSRRVFRYPVVGVLESTNVDDKVSGQI